MKPVNEPCPICAGSKMIRLPVRRPLQVMMQAVDPTPRGFDDSVRSYPCPECTTVPDHQLHVAGAASSIRGRDLRQHPDARRIVRKGVVHNLAEYMLRHDLVQFTEQPDPSGEPDMVQVFAKLAVVTPDRITPLEERVKEATRPVVEKVATLAIEKIGVWGSAYGRIDVSKEEAARFIREAAREATA